MQISYTDGKIVVYHGGIGSQETGDVYTKAYKLSPEGQFEVV